jgi:hypothetical protein
MSWKIPSPINPTAMMLAINMPVRLIASPYE